jgi:hypothetical protein
VNDFLTAYLRALNTLSGGSMSPAQAMDRLIGFVSAAQGARTAVAKFLKPDDQGRAGGRAEHA